MKKSIYEIIILEKDFRAIDVIDDIYSYIQYNSVFLKTKMQNLIDNKISSDEEE